MPCILVTFDKEQIVVWRGVDYKPSEDGYSFTHREEFNDSDDNVASGEEACDKFDERSSS